MTDAMRKLVDTSSRLRRALTAAGLLAVLAFGLAGVSSDPAVATPTGEPPAPYSCWLGKQLSDLVELVSPAVVRVVTYRGHTRMIDGEPRVRLRRLVASGVVIAPHGCVVTTARVAQPGDSILVHFPDGRKALGHYVGMDRATNVAVVGLPADQAYPYLKPPETPDVHLPQWVAAVAYGPWKGGQPLMPSLTLAQRDAIEPIPMKFGETKNGAWRIRAPLFPGNGGGALVTLSGEWIGLVTGAIAGEPGSGRRDACAPSGEGVIVPAAAVACAAREIESGERMSEGFLGVATDGREPSEGDRASAGEHCVVVSEVLTGSPADRYGIQRGDLIVSFGAEPIDSVGELTQLVHRAAPGDEVRIGIERHGRLRTVDVLMGDRSATYIYLQNQQQARARRRSLQQDLKDLDRRRHSVLEQLEKIGRQPRTDPPPPPKGRASSSSP